MICAVVLAAGHSERMGVPKLLLPLAGKTVIAHVVDALVATPLDEIRVVLGAEREAIARVLDGQGLRFVVNTRPASDMLASIRCGLRELPAGCEAVLVALGDQPTITPSLVRHLIREFRAATRTILFPTHGGRRGHPVLLAVRHVPELLERHAGVGLRGLIEAHPDAVLPVAVDDPGVLEDVDTPADYVRVAARLRGAQ